MGRDDNVAVMQRAYEAFNTADMETLTELFDESATCCTRRGESSFSGDREGREATFVTSSVGWGRTPRRTFRAEELRHMLEDDDGGVVGVQTSTGERNGRQLEVGNCIVFELKDGRITDGREHFEDLYAWDEFWS